MIRFASSLVVSAALIFPLAHARAATVSFSSEAAFLGEANPVRTAIKEVLARRGSEFRYRAGDGSPACVNGAGETGYNVISVEELLDTRRGECADLSGLDLEGARLDGANLRGADLVSAVLNNADLRGADLVGARLKGVDLEGADLTGAVYDETTILPFDEEEAAERGMTRKDSSGPSTHKRF